MECLILAGGLSEQASYHGEEEAKDRIDQGAGMAQRGGVGRAGLVKAGVPSFANSTGNLKS